MIGHVDHTAQAVDDEDCENEQLGDREYILGLAGHFGPAGVQADKRHTDQERDQQDRTAFAQESERPFAHTGQILQEELPEIAGEAQGVEATRHGVGEPKHPSRRKTHRPRKGPSHVCITASGFRDGGGQLRVGEGRQERHGPVKGKRQDRGGAGYARRDAREHEDAGADHGSDTDHGRVEEAEGPGERERRRLGSFGVRTHTGLALMRGWAVL